MTNAGVFDLSPSDLLDRALRDAGRLGDGRPRTLGRAQFADDVFVHRVHDERILDPSSGFCNPLMGAKSPENNKPMKGKPKSRKIPGFMRFVLAENVSKLMNRAYKESRNKPKALSLDAGVSLSTIQRILEMKSGATLDSIEQVASAFDLSTYQVLIPGLDIDAPPIVPGALQSEKTKYRRWQQKKLDPMESE